MSNYNHIARPYAKAAFEYARDHSLLTEWQTLIKQTATFLAFPEIQRAMLDFDISELKITGALIALLSAENKQKPELHFINFLTLLAQKDRLIALPSIQVLYEKFKLEEEKIIDTIITLAEPASDDYIATLTEKLERKFNSHIKVEIKIDPKIIGGIIIEGNDNIIDGSIRYKLDKLGSSLIA